MKKILPFFIIMILTSLPCHPETIKLKNGKTIETTITEKTDEYIKIDFHGVSLTYYVEDIEAIDGITLELKRKQKTVSKTIDHDASSNDIDVQHIRRILKDLGYPEHTWLDIERELTAFLAKIDFPQLKKEAEGVKSDSLRLKTFIAKIGGLINEEEQLIYPDIHPLLIALVNDLAKEDVRILIESSPLPPEEKKKKKWDVFACSAVSQLGSIILTLMGIDGKIALSPNHAFNYIPINNHEVTLVDFTKQVFEIIDIEYYYKTEGSYRVLKPEHRLHHDRVTEVREQAQRGEWGFTQKEILNVAYFYLFLTDSYSATPYIHTNRGRAYIDKGDLNQAIADFNRALQIDSNLAEAYTYRGYAYLKQYNLNQAIADFNRALQINPNHADAYNNRGLAYVDKGDLNQAIADFNRALQISSPSHALAYYNRGSAYSQKGNFSQAIADYNQALQIDPNYADAYNNRAVAYFFKGDYTQAWQNVHKAQALGAQVHPDFLQELRRASGRNR